MAPKKAKAASPKKAAAAAETGDDYDTWSIAKLKDRLKELNLTATGGKESLIERLRTCAPAAEAKQGTKRSAPADEPEPPSKRGKAAAPKEPAVEPAEPKAKRGKAAAPPPSDSNAKGRSVAKAAEPPPPKRGASAPEEPVPRGTAKAKAAKAPDQDAQTQAEPPSLEAASMVFYEDGEFKVEYAKSNRSFCKRCNEKIEKDALRIGKMVDSDKFDGKVPAWHHAKCFLEGSLLPSSVSLIEGFSSLRPEDQKLILSKVPKDATSGSTGRQDSKIQTQNKKVFEVKDALSELSEAEIKEMLELNDYPTKKLGDMGIMSTMVDLCADGIVFGACCRCQECADEEKEKRGGHVLLSGESYKCTGWVSEFLRCTARTQTPERTEWELTPAAKKISKLAKMKLKTSDRLFATKLSAEGDDKSGAGKSSAPKPALLGLIVAVHSTEDMDKAELEQLVRKNGGQIIGMNSVSKAVNCVISTEEAAEKEAEELEKAKELHIPGVTEAFLKESVEAGSQVDMTPYLLWGESRRKDIKETGTKFVEKHGVSIDADVGSEVLTKAHVLVDKAEGRVYSEMLSATDMLSGVNSFYTLHLLESDEGTGEDAQYWVFRKWGRIGVNQGGKLLEEHGTNKAKAIKSFGKWYLDKTGNTFGHKKDEFEAKPGKFNRVDVVHKALQKDGAAGQNDGDTGGEQTQPFGQLSKAQIDKADKVLDKIEAALNKTGTSGVATFMALSAEYYTLVPHNFGMKKPPPINNEEILGAEKALLQFYIRMGFDEVGGDEKKLAPIAGVMELELPASLPEACKAICAPKEAKTCVTKGATMEKKKAGSPKKPMPADLYGAILMYTGNAIYKQLNQALRDENRAKIRPFFPFLRMLFEACARLPTEAITLWRGISVDLFDSYKVGSIITWWGVSSCTSDQKVAQNFANSCGDKSSLLTIESKTACNISQVSFYANESESILLPGTQLEVISRERKGKQAHIKLREVGRCVG